MNGVAAILGYEITKSRDLITEMCKALEHRGPASGKFLDSDIALGNVGFNNGSSKVSIQPVCDTEKVVWITFDGCIFNKTDFNSKRSDNTSIRNLDAEAVIDAYRVYGKNFVNHLDGFFAFCLWDSAKSYLICARDRFGVKPLYYSRSNDKCILASEIRALFVDETISRKPNHGVIRSFLLNGGQYRNGETFFEGIKEVLPGHCMYFYTRGNRVQDYEYWHLPRKVFFQKKNVNCANEFLRIFRDSIQRMLPKAGMLATSMAGLDSQAIASIVADMVSRSGALEHIPISAVFRSATTEDNEEPFMREYASFHKTKVEYVHLPDALTWQDAKDFVAASQEPFSPYCYVYWSISKELNRRGVRIAFLGLGADPLLWGTDRDRNSYLKSLWRKRDIGTLIVETIGSLGQQDISYNLLERVVEVARNNLVPASIVFDTTRFFQRQYLSKKFDRICNNSIDPLRAEILGYVVEAERLFASNSVEPRSPFLDTEFANFIVSLPPNQKIRRGVKKFVLRRAIKNLIPDAVLKSKRKFPTPVPSVEWLKMLRPEITRMLSSKEFRQRQIFNSEKILETYISLCEEKLNLTEIRKFTELIWRIINLELWFQMYIDPHIK